MPQVARAKKKASITAALPRSFAFFESGFLSRETRSTTASIAELSNSIINTSSNTAINAWHCNHQLLTKSVLMLPRCAKPINRIKHRRKNTLESAFALEFANRLTEIAHKSEFCFFLIKLPEGFSRRSWHVAIIRPSRCQWQ